MTMAVETLRTFVARWEHFKNRGATHRHGLTTEATHRTCVGITHATNLSLRIPGNSNSRYRRQRTLVFTLRTAVRSQSAV